MAHFYGNMQGSRGETTRMGTKASGIRGHLRGWDIGANVRCFERDGVDYVSISVTCGSNGDGTEMYLGTFTRGDGGIVRC